MIGTGKVLALIPARSGSKRLPQKNTLPLAGTPLIAWTIREALRSDYIDDVVVSTDDEKIASISKAYGAEVPFLRPEELAGDESKTIDVVLHAINTLYERNYEYFILLQPTSPLRTHHHIDEAIAFLVNKNANAVVSVTDVDYPIEWTLVLPDDLSMDNEISKMRTNKRSQELIKRYRLNGAIYINSVKNILDNKSLYPDSGCFAYKMDKQASIDIDEAVDFKLAEALIS